MLIEYPKWMYHRTEPAQIVEDPAAEDALGPDWAETPAAFDEPAEPEQPKKKGGKK